MFQEVTRLLETAGIHPLFLALIASAVFAFRFLSQLKALGQRQRQKRFVFAFRSEIQELLDIARAQKDAGINPIDISQEIRVLHRYHRRYMRSRHASKLSENAYYGGTLAFYGLIILGGLSSNEPGAAFAISVGVAMLHTILRENSRTLDPSRFTSIPIAIFAGFIESLFVFIGLLLILSIASSF